MFVSSQQQKQQPQQQNFNQYGNPTPAYNNAPSQNYGGHSAAPAQTYGGPREPPMQSYGAQPAPAPWSQEPQWTANPVPAQGNYGYQGQSMGYGQQQQQVCLFLKVLGIVYYISELV